MPERSPSGRLVTAGRLVHGAAFAEPGVALAGDRWWAVASSGPAGLLPTLSSVDLVHWQREPSALGELGGWAIPGSVRSPELVEAGPVETGPGRWLLFHGAVRAEDGSAALGVAAATDPGGVFADVLGCPLVVNGTDPAVLRVGDGTRWLYWADTGTSADRPGRIRASRLTDDGLALVGPGPVTVLTADHPWQAGVVVAPQVIPTTTGLLMFYETGRPDSSDRCLAIARAMDPVGPFVADPAPLLRSGARYDGPGHPAVVTDPGGRSWLLFSAWPPNRAGTPGARQHLWLAAVDLDHHDLDAVDSDATGCAAPVGAGAAARLRGPVVSEPVPAPGPLPESSGRWRLPVPDDPSAEQERVLRAFTVHGAIRAVPARHHLRVVLLDLLAQLFEPGVRYPEAEVDRRLTGIWAPGIHPDYARLRRLLVDQNFLDRRDGIYRRSGGTV